MFVILIAGIFIVGQTIQRASAQASGNQEQAAIQPDHSKTVLDTDSNAVRAPSLRPSLRISIPYGFDTPLPIINGGRDVVASGHGGCTDGQQVTIAVTITHATSGAVATGEKVQDCTGVMQTWSTIATAETTSSFTAGMAEACGFATTRDDGEVTDTFDWCKDVDLIELTEQFYLPIIMKP